MKGDFIMRDLFWLSEEQLNRIKPCFPYPHGKPRVDDLRVISGIIFVLKRGVQWRDAPKEYGPHKTLYNRFIRWSEKGIFNKIFARLAAEDGIPEQLQIDATHLKAHRTAASLLKKGLFPAVSDAQKAA
jgi:transposase